MPFQTDERLAAGEAKVFGEYLTTFTSATGQVRADYFKRGGVVTAYTSFPTGLTAANVSDPYIVEVWQYARERGLQDQFRVVYSQAWT